MAAPRVTIGMPVYNRAHILPETLGYVFAQTFSDYELLIYDDGSTDGTSQVLAAIQDPRVRVIGRERLGPPHPLNAINRVARGEYVIILHDHDIFDPTLIEKSVAALEAYPQAGFVLQGCAVVGEDGRSRYQAQIRDWAALSNGREHAVAMLTADAAFASPFHACSMVRRSALVAVGNRYEPSFGLHADVDLWLRLLRVYDFVYLPEVLFRFRERPKRGHILRSREFEVLDIQRDIFLRNGAALFAGEPRRLQNFDAQVAAMHARQERRLALRALKNPPELARLASSRVAANHENPLLVRIVARVLSALAPSARIASPG